MRPHKDPSGSLKINFLCSVCEGAHKMTIVFVRLHGPRLSQEQLQSSLSKPSCHLVTLKSTLFPSHELLIPNKDKVPNQISRHIFPQLSWQIWCDLSSLVDFSAKQNWLRWMTFLMNRGTEGIMSRGSGICVFVSCILECLWRYLCVYDWTLLYLMCLLVTLASVFTCFMSFLTNICMTAHIPDIKSWWCWALSNSFVRRWENVNCFGNICRLRESGGCKRMP